MYRLPEGPRCFRDDSNSHHQHRSPTADCAGVFNLNVLPLGLEPTRIETDAPRRSSSQKPPPRANRLRRIHPPMTRPYAPSPGPSASTFPAPPPRRNSARPTSPSCTAVEGDELARAGDRIERPETENRALRDEVEGSSSKMPSGKRKASAVRGG
ncbi:unnamed protein product [Musa textilis]